MKKLKRNAIQCRKCGDVIESKFTRDFKYCLCRSVGVDGGLEYARIQGIWKMDVFAQIPEMGE
ncbi:hypothetical protein [Bacillus cereus group sp. BfR-BA-01329]|uniref:DUF7695 domain-containing protein n=1 Tax=Bacillus cereus group sp. BfR-BA-01329 TaxID=2920305 RepID=UPI001F56AD78|nr:hypothetical protein [Bacillus cereus group sp. BfR-BA-01329]